MMQKPILVLAGPSSAGKTVGAEKLLSIDGRFSFLRSVTTRKPRNDHKDEYIYTTPEAFLNMKEQGMLLEYMEYADNMYGTPKSELDRVWQEGKIPCLILDLTGVKSLSVIDGLNVCFIYVYTDLFTAEERLYERFLSSDRSPKELTDFVKRKQRNIADFMNFGEYDHLFYGYIHNDSTVENLADMIQKTFDAFLNAEEKDESSRARLCSVIEESLKKLK